MSAQPTRPSTDIALYRRVLRQVRPYWLHIACLFLLSLLATPLILLAPLPLKIAVDSVVGSEALPHMFERFLPQSLTRDDEALLVLAAGLLVLTVLLTQLQTIATSLLRTYTGERMVLEFRKLLLRRAQRLSLMYHDTKGSSDSTFRIHYDAQSIQYLAIDGIIPFVTSVITLVSMVYIIVRLDWVLALVALAISPVLSVATGFNKGRLRRRSSEVRSLESSAMGIVQEVLSSIRVVKAFAQEDREEHRFVTRSREGLLAKVRLAILEGGVGAIVAVTTAVGTAAVLYIGATHVQSGVLTLGELLLVMGYLTQLYEPLKRISRTVVVMQSNLASAERAFSLLDQPQDVEERHGARPIARAEGAVAFRSVSFAYRPDQFVLRDVTFDVAPGTRVGIAGTTGAGKTTLVSLLCRFYDPIGGSIKLDGIDLRDYRVSDLRNQFAIVLQEPVLFSTTIAENIAYARDSATMDDVVAAAMAANAHDFIAATPQGYETLVGERGMRLSGGERQRISLARAFLKDAPILVLDEPTSSVDVKTEALIMEAMGRLMEGRTTFMIAHRLSTLDLCDTRVQIEGGRIVGSAVSHSRGSAPTVDVALRTG